MFSKVLNLVILLTCLNFSSGNFTSRFEFEKVVGGPGSSRSPWRSNASSASSLRMFEGDSIHVELCLPETTAIKPSSVLYSNDGLPDTIGVRIDEMYEFGPVDTGETLGGWGNDWNEFKSHNFSQPSVGLEAGNHVLVFEVLSSDCFGTELDAVDLMTNIPVDTNTFICGSKLIRSANPSSCAEDVDSAMTPSTSTKAPSSQEVSTSTTETQMVSRQTISTGLPTQERTTVTQSTTTSRKSAMLTVSTVITSKPSVSAETTSAKTSPSSPTMSSPTQERTTITQSTTTSRKSAMLTVSTGITSKPSVSAETTSAKTSSSSPTMSSTASTTSGQPAVQDPTKIVSSSEQTVSSVTVTPTEMPSPKVVSTLTPNTTTAVTTMMSTSSTEKEMAANMSTKPFSTTTSTFTPPMTKSSTPYHTVNDFVKQLSFSSNCITSTNVRLQFKPVSLNGVQIIAKNNPQRQTSFRRRESTDDDPQICKNQIWQIGKFNNDYKELGPLRYKNVDYDVNAPKGSQMPFPGLLNPQFTRSVTIRYIVPKNVNIGKGFVYLSFGLADVTSDAAVGMQYHIRRKKNPSKVEYVTITPENNVVGWDLPARAVSPSLENIITLYFNKSMASPLKIDFIRLESLGVRPKLKKENIARTKQWRVRAFLYKPHKKRPTPEGMKVTIGGGKPFLNTDRVFIFKKPFRKALAIYKNGRIFPVNQLKKSDDDAEGSKFTDISGFVLGRSELEIKSVDFDTDKGIATLTYNDGSYVKFTLTYNKLRTKLAIIESTIPNPTVEFLSTYITNYVTAVNEVVIDNTKGVDVKDKAIEDTKNRQYTFIKTTPNKMYKVNDEYELLFPKNVLPK